METYVELITSADGCTSTQIGLEIYYRLNHKEAYGKDKRFKVKLKDSLQSCKTIHAILLFRYIFYVLLTTKT